MLLLKTIDAGGTRFNFFTTRGEVVDEKKWSTTHVSGGGMSNAAVSSRTEEHDQFLLREKDGHERAVTLVGARLAMRKGHEVSLLLGIREGKETGPYLAVHNHSTGQSTPLRQGVSILAEGQFLRMAAALAVAAIGTAVAALVIFSLLSGQLFRSGSPIAGLLFALFGAAAAWFGFNFLLARVRRIRAIDAAVKEAVANLRGQSRH